MNRGMNDTAFALSDVVSREGINCGIHATNFVLSCITIIAIKNTATVTVFHSKQ